MPIIDALTPSELEFLARELLLLQKYIWAKSAAEVPEACGHYVVYRRIQMAGAGLSHDLRKSFPGQSRSMWGAPEPDLIFLYRLDDDGSVARWLDQGPEPDEDEEEDIPGFCTKCGAPG